MCNYIPVNHKSPEKNRPHTFIYNFAKNTQIFLHINLFSIFF